MPEQRVNTPLTGEQVRSEIHFEHTQLSQRMGWYASTQTFMFTAYALSANGDFKAIPKISLPILGIVFSILAWIAIFMAVRRLRGWWDHQPDWGVWPTRQQYLALAYPLGTPICIGMFWLSLLVKR